jgi:hypothetical protein
MGVLRRTLGCILLLAIPFAVSNCATGGNERAEASNESHRAQDHDRGEYATPQRRRGRRIFKRPAKSDGTAAPTRTATREGDDRARQRQSPKEIRARIHAAFVDARRRVHAELQQNIQAQLGLEAIGDDGRVTEIPVTTQTRPLRDLTAVALQPQLSMFFTPEGLALELYRNIPEPILPENTRTYTKTYVGDAASAIAMEAKLIVDLKGGEWVEPAEEERVANAIAVRGLDLEEGLVQNGNQTYDDTAYIILEEGNGGFEVYEFRMTTESSNPERGVGRLKAKQVIYVRGLHKGTDPAFRLLGNAAEGTRAGIEGEFQIVGANMHSAYTWRQIDSQTPLSPNVSLGCQVIATNKSDFEKSLVFLLDRKGVDRFPYTIVADKELQVLDALLQEQGKKSILVHGLPRGGT